MIQLLIKFCLALTNLAQHQYLASTEFISVSLNYSFFCQNIIAAVD